MTELIKGNEINKIETVHFNDLIKEINEGMLKGDLDSMCDKLKIAIDFYEENDLDFDISNVFDRASNILEGFTKKTQLLEQLMRIVDISESKNNMKSFAVYSRYYALAQSFYYSTEKGLEIIENAESLLDEDSGLYIELENARALIYSMDNENERSLKILIDNFEKARRIKYTPGYRFAQNIGFAYRELEKYDEAIVHFKLGIEYNFQLGFEQNAVNGLLELAELYVLSEKFDKSLATLKSVSKYDIMTANLALHKSFCSSMYITLKNMGRFEEALSYHETLLSLLLLLNHDKFEGMIDELNIKYDFTESERENTLIKIKNYNLELLSEKLNNTNNILKTTLKKSNEMQQELMAKNQELEATMEDLKNTQEKLLTVEKHAILDGMVINISENMNSPLGVMNTATSHIKRYSKKTISKYKEGKLSRTDLEKYFDAIVKSTEFYEESMLKLIDFVDAMKHYKVDDDGEGNVIINVNDYLLEKKFFWQKTKGLDDINIICKDNIELEVRVSFLNKCLNILVDTILNSITRKGFDIEVSDENEIVSIGIGDFSSTENSKSDITENSYDYYIVQVIIEDLLNGRFIQFEDSGKKFYQFIFPKYK